MKTNLIPFYSLRVYRNLSLRQIFTSLLCNRLMRSQTLVKNSPRLYSYSIKILGKTIPNFILEQTFCKMLTAGNTLTDTDTQANHYRRQNVAIILDYCAEGHLSNTQLEVTLDSNADMFMQTGKHLVNNKNQLISIKITGLIDMKLLKKMNDSVLSIHKLWSQNNQNGILTSQKLYAALHKICPAITQQNYHNYLKTIHNHHNIQSQFTIDQVGFKMNHHPFYLESNKNKDFVIGLFFPTNKQEQSKAANFVRRLEEICEPFAKNQNGFKILVDAQQTYVQRAIESISEQLQAKYNKDRLYIIPTVQNYLKISVNRTKYQVEIAKRRNLIFGAKLVRGAYIVQQTKLSQQLKYQSPIVQSFEKTTQNYLGSLQYILANSNNGQIVVATHNQDTIKAAKQLRLKHSSDIKLSYAQLLGLADHLTWQLKQSGERVYKYLPWAKTQVMIAYMIRRAQQLQQMRYPLDIQQGLLIHELKSRYLH